MGVSMEALTSLIRRAEPGDPLAQAMSAILDSGLIVMTRDSEGRFVQVSAVLGERLSLGDGRGDLYTREMHYYDGHERLVAVSETPAQQTRMSGRGRRNELNRLETPGGEIWMQVSNLPLERGPEGWSVLTIGADVTEIVAARDAARRAASVSGMLVELGATLVERRVTDAELVELLREPMAELAPAGNVLLMRQDGSEFETASVHHGFGTEARTGRAHLSSILRERWRGPGPHVNQNVQETDIYCGTVIAELDDQYRSVAVAPAGGPEELAALMATHPGVDAFEEWQIESLELAARLVRAALYPGVSRPEQQSA